MNTVWNLVVPSAAPRYVSLRQSHSGNARLSSLPASANGLTGNRVSVGRTCDLLV
jgi:hypothetical protein